MANHTRPADVLAGVEAEIRTMARAQRDRAELTATASEADGRVTVVVAGDGRVVQTRFTAGVGELTRDQVAAAFTAAAAAAARAVRQQGNALIAAARHQRAGSPGVAELVAAMPDFTALRDMLPGRTDPVPEPDSESPVRPRRSSGPWESSW
jgi:hypothetical protein